MEATERAVVRLTEHHTEHTEAGAVEWQPLLLWLRERVTDINRRGGGSGGIGVPLNNDAMEILNHIERRYRLLCEAAYMQPGGHLTSGTARVWAQLKADRAQGTVDDARWEMICAEFPDWVARIETEQDRPRRMEMTTPCPRCEARWIMDAGDRKAAVVIEYADGRAPVAECRNPECGALWAGWGEVAKLGFTVGAAQDMAVLAACGIDMPVFGGIATV